MKIKSSFKDYYDYIQGLYGSGDPFIIYERNKIKYGKNNDKPKIYLNILEFKDDYLYEPYEMGGKIKNYIKILSICGKVFYTIEINNTFKIFDKNNHIHNKIFEEHYRKDYILLKDENVLCSNVYNKLLYNISIKIKQPVFLLNSITTFNLYEGQKGEFAEIDRNIPILKNYGISSLIKAETLYQEIAHFIANDLKKENPIIEVSDKDKIIKHGFDNKISFRPTCRK